jgi:hypothetical protein
MMNDAFLYCFSEMAYDERRISFIALVKWLMMNDAFLYCFSEKAYDEQRISLLL